MTKRREGGALSRKNLINSKMVRKKHIRIHKILLSAIIILFSVESLQVFAEEPQRIVKITVCPNTFINKNFYGFGAETLPWLWTKENREAGVNADDIRLNTERIKDMRLPITRIFVPWETWNPSIDYKTFTWGSDAMQSLYKTLDLYQEMGTRVIIVTVDWLKDSPWRNTEASAEAVLRLLEYLVKEKGYTCIQFWTLTNEPELTYGWLKKMPFENYVRIHRLVKEGLKKRRLSVKIIASDEVESQEWFDKSARYLSGVADIFSSHAYFYPGQIYLIPDFFRERLNIVKKASLVTKGIPFFLCEFGFRGSNFSSSTNSLMGDYEYGLYVAQLCIEVLNSGVDSASLWCQYQIRLIDEIKPEGGKIMRIGLWAYKDENWRPFPIFYLYRLFTRYIKSGSRVLKTWVSHPDILKAACAEQGGNYSLFVVNPTDKEQIFLIKWKRVFIEYKKYIYNKSNFSLKGNAVKVKDRLKVRDYIKDTIPPQSVILYTNLEND